MRYQKLAAGLLLSLSATVPMAQAPSSANGPGRVPFTRRSRDLIPHRASLPC